MSAAADARQDLAKRLRWQASGCRHIGSPLYGELLDRAAEDLEAGGPTWEILRGEEARPLGDMVPLRFMGAVHRLVLEGRAPDLAPHYSGAGSGDGAAPESRIRRRSPA